MKISDSDVEIIIDKVLQNVEALIGNKGQLSKSTTNSVPAGNGNLNKGIHLTNLIGDGVFEKVEDAIEAAFLAQKEYIKTCNLQVRDRIVANIRKNILDNVNVLAEMIYKETKLGKVEHKVQKLTLVATKTPGTEDITTSSISGDNGLTIEEMGAYGLIGAVTPVTNPAETIINNAISMIAAGNGVVFNVHPSAKNCSAYTVQLLNNAIKDAGGPANLVTMVKNPTMDSVKVITSSPRVRLMVGTGGPALVRSLLSSGKKAIGAGAGNPPVIVDDTADLALAARCILDGASFDNNILCIAEKEIFVLDSVADDLIYEFLKLDTHLLTKNELESVMELTLTVEEVNAAKSCSSGCNPGTKKEYHVAKGWVGKDASKIMESINNSKPNVKLLLCEVDASHPYVQLEQMMPILPIVRVKTFQEAIERAVDAEHGNRHTASIFSKNIDNMTEFARAIDTTIFVKNAATLAGVGDKGEGCATMTIAGPTGEGITSARTFTRVRRCVLAEGGFRIT